MNERHVRAATGYAVAEAVSGVGACVPDHPPLADLANMLNAELIRGQAAADRVEAALEPGGPAPAQPGGEERAVCSLYDHVARSLQRARELADAVERMDRRLHGGK